MGLVFGGGTGIHNATSCRQVKQLVTILNRSSLLQMTDRSFLHPGGDSGWISIIGRFWFTDERCPGSHWKETAVQDEHAALQIDY
jgi:hypothetical protein